MLLCNSETTAEVIDRKGGKSGNQIMNDISLTDNKFDSKQGQNYRFEVGFKKMYKSKDIALVVCCIK